jgi:hypothetical protein
MNNMRAKFIALALLISAAFGTSHALGVRDTVAASSEAATIVLLPDTLAGYHIERSWNQAPFNGLFTGPVREEGALYSPVVADSGDPIQLDFFRNTRVPHNGVRCFLLRGEMLRSESMHTVQTRGGSAVFDVAFMEAEHHLRLAAATECLAEGCAETDTARVGRAPWQHWSLHPSRLANDKAVVPFSIMIERGNLSDPDAVAAAETQLMHEFEATAAQLDLQPAQRLAAALH